jgi:dTMP kinase
MSLFLSFEGPDGSGKSTQARHLVEALRRNGFGVLATHEPGGTPIGDRIRDLALDRSSPAAIPLATAFLMSASRAQLVETVIRPALQSGLIVIADRYADSTMAYQAFGMGALRDDVRTLTRVATRGLLPDATIYVDVLPEIGLARLLGRPDLNKLDIEALSFHQRVREGYHQLMQEDPGRWLVVNGEASEGEVHVGIMDSIKPLLARVEQPI